MCLSKMPPMFRNQEGFNFRAGYRLSESAAMQPRLCAARLNVKRLNLPARMGFFGQKRVRAPFEGVQIALHMRLLILVLL